MKNIYLDHNIFCFLQEINEFEDLYNKILSLKKAYIFPYSPGHIEEVATIYRQNTSTKNIDERVGKIINTISHISGNNEILPTPFGKNIIKKEDPKICLKRVIDQYGITLWAEHHDKNLAYRINKEALAEIEAEEDIIPFIDLREQHGIESKVIGNITPEDIFKQENVISFFKSNVPNFDLVNLMGSTWKEIEGNGEKIAIIIERLMKGLYKIGYKSDKKKKYRSSMHDITHAIYATDCDYFVTNDIKTGYLDRVKAIYHFLQIPTQVISMEDFLLLEEKI